MKYILVVFILAIISLCFYIFIEVYLEKYDTRIYTSPYDQDVSFVFTGIRSHMDFAEKMDTICAIAQTMEAPFNNISTGDIQQKAR